MKKIMIMNYMCYHWQHLIEVILMHCNKNSKATEI